MKPKSLFAGMATALLLSVPAAAQPPVTSTVSQGWRAMGSAGVVRVPGLTEMLDRYQELGLSASQVESLENLAVGVIRETIRRQSELMLAQVDLAVLVDPDPSKAVDVAKTEAKLREIERIRTDLQLALVRAIEAAKSELTPDQRARLATGTTDLAPVPGDPPGQGGPSGQSSPRGQSSPTVIMARAPGHAPSGGGGSRPGAPSAPHAPGAPRPPAPGGHFAPHRHFDGGPRVRVFAGPSFWWDPYWTYPLPPVIIQEPPVYTPPPQAYWYYCPSLGAYYPYTPSCPDPWVPVPSS